MKKNTNPSISKVVGEYYMTEKKFLSALNSVIARMKKLENATKKLDVAVETFNDVGNPISVLAPIWKELPLKRKEALYDRFNRVYGSNLSLVDFDKTVDSMIATFELLAKNADQFRIADTEATQVILGSPGTA